MLLKREAKQAIVEEFGNVAEAALDLVTIEHRDLKVSDITDLRNKAREKNIYVQVIRNTLAKRALSKTAFACLQAELTGPLLFVFSMKEGGAAARLVRDFAKLHKKLVVRNLVVEGELFEQAALNSIANLPTRVEAIAKLMSVLQAPLQQLLRVVAAPHAKLVRTVKALESKKQEQNT